MEDLRTQIVDDIKEQLDFIFQNENNITDFSVVGKEIGIDDMDGYMISGYIPIEGASADLFYSIDINEDSFRIDFIPPALPLTQDLLERIDLFNSNSKYNTEYLERYITVHRDEFKLNDDVVGAINLYTEDNNRIATATMKDMYIILDALINIKALENCNR